MGNCASNQHKISFNKETVELMEKYKNILYEIKACRMLIIGQDIRNLSLLNSMKEDFSFQKDLQLIQENCQGMDLKFQFNTTVHLLQQIETRFQHLEKTQKIYLDKKIIAKNKNDKNQKIQKTYQEISTLRQKIYDYFYCDLELTDVPNELI